MTVDKLESTEQLTGVAETLMITLYSRYLETQRSDSFLEDPKAVEITNKINYDFKKYDKGWISQLSIAIRVRELDRIAKNFLDNHPNAVVINLGCGLCTRFVRINNGTDRWYEIDLPEVIEFRRKFLEESDRCQFIAKSILDFSWIDEIKRSPEQPLLILMEGVTMYLTESENRAIVREICDRLAPTNFIFDVISRNVAKSTKNHDTVSKTDAEFKFGIDKGQELENWQSGIAMKEEIYYLTQFANYPQRLPYWGNFLSFILVRLVKNSGRIINIQIYKK